MLVLVLERDCNYIRAERSIFIQRILSITSQTNAVLCNGRERAEFLSRSLTMLVNSSDFVVEIYYGDVEGLFVDWLRSPPGNIAFSIRAWGLASDKFLDPERQLSCCHGEASYDYYIRPSSLEQVGEFILILLVHQIVKFDVFTQPSHFVQKNKGNGVLLGIPLPPRDGEDGGRVYRLCIPGDKGGNIDALKVC